MTITATINAQVKSLVEDVKALPESLLDTSKLRAQAQGFAHTALGQATGVYADLTKKGEEFVAKAKGFTVDDIKKTVGGLKGKAEEVVEDVTTKTEGLAADAQKKAEAFVADARATVNKVTKKAPVAKPAPAKPVAKKAPAKPAAKKAPAKPAAKKAAPKA